MSYIRLGGVGRHSTEVVFTLHGQAVMSLSLIDSALLRVDGTHPELVSAVLQKNS